MKPVSRRTGFAEILNHVQEENANRIIQRARLANRLAKSLQGIPRGKAYRVKHAALLALARKFPERITVARDAALAGFVVVALPAAGFGLHLPESCFHSSEGLRWAA